MRWILAIEDPNVSLEALADVSEHPQLDSKIGAGCHAILEGRIGQEINIEIEEALKSATMGLSGRQILRIIYNNSNNWGKGRRGEHPAVTYENHPLL